MSQMPPGGPPNFPPGAPAGYSLPPSGKTSGAAITSLVCGLIMCVPFVTGLVAIITGFVGVSATKNPGVRGRGLAIAGIILGFISIVGWGLFGSAILALVHGSAPDRAFAKQYISDLSAGNVDQCVQNSSSKLTKAQIQANATQMQPWGTLQDTTVFAFSVNNNNGNYGGVVSGAAKFSGGQHTFALTLVKDSGTLKVDTFQWTR
jgi:hypothetical protein